MVKKVVLSESDSDNDFNEAPQTLSKSQAQIAKRNAEAIQKKQPKLQKKAVQKEALFS